jgi:hypothetical protein
MEPPEETVCWEMASLIVVMEALVVVMLALVVVMPALKVVMLASSLKKMLLCTGETEEALDLSY